MPENPAAEKMQVLQVLDRLRGKLQEKGDTTQNEKLSAFYETLKSPLFNQILTLQQSIKQLKGQLSHIPSDCSANFDFSRKGLLVFTDGSITNGNAHRPCSSITASESLPWTQRSGNEDFTSVIQQMAQVRVCLVMDSLALLFFFCFSLKRKLVPKSFCLTIDYFVFVCLCFYLVKRN